VDARGAFSRLSRPDDDAAGDDAGVVHIDAYYGFFFYPHEHPAGPANDGRYADGGAGGGGGGGGKGATSAFPR